MRIDELKPSQARLLKQGRVVPEYIDTQLKDWGFEQVDTGKYSAVYAQPSRNIVVKVSNEEGIDDCWIKFSKIARENHQNPHFPKIGKVHTPTHDGEQYMVVFMEKLQPLGHQMENTLFQNALESISYAIMMGDFEALVFDKDISESGGKYSSFWIARDEGILPGSFIKAIWTLDEQMPEQCFSDLHLDNIMQRKDGTLVIIDPWAMRA